MTLLPAAVILAAAAVVWGLVRIAQALRDARDEARRSRTLQILSLFTTGVAAAADDPKAILAWQPLAAASRALFPDEFASLDKAAGASFPFSAAQIDQAHSRWTADWLAWELAHDTEFKLKAARAAAAIAGGAATALQRTELDAIEREKLERYQTRYGEYVKVAKGLQALMTGK